MSVNAVIIWMLLWIPGQCKSLTDRLQCSWRTEVKSSISLTGKALTKTLSSSERKRKRETDKASRPEVHQSGRH